MKKYIFITNLIFIFIITFLSINLYSDVKKLNKNKFKLNKTKKQKEISNNLVEQKISTHEEKYYEDSDGTVNKEHFDHNEYSSGNDKELITERNDNFEIFFKNNEIVIKKDYDNNYLVIYLLNDEEYWPIVYNLNNHNDLSEAIGNINDLLDNRILKKKDTIKKLEYLIDILIDLEEKEDNYTSK